MKLKIGQRFYDSMLGEYFTLGEPEEETYDSKITFCLMWNDGLGNSDWSIDSINMYIHDKVFIPVNDNAKTFIEGLK